jgi:hypothetical protein
MNVDRIAHRAAEIGVRRTETARRPFDLTVSDRGVEERTQPTAVRDVPAVASTSQMQSVLSSDETQALRAAFFDVGLPSAAEEKIAPTRPGGVYNLRGQSAVRAERMASGSLLDITG